MDATATGQRPAARARSALVTKCRIRIVSGRNAPLLDILPWMNFVTVFPFLALRVRYCLEDELHLTFEYSRNHKLFKKKTHKGTLLVNANYWGILYNFVDCHWHNAVQ